LGRGGLRRRSEAVALALVRGKRRLRGPSETAITVQHGEKIIRSLSLRETLEKKKTKEERRIYKEKNSWEENGSLRRGNAPEKKERP